MLLLTVVYEGERDLITQLNEIKNYFREKKLILGISESITGDTHFIKLFCGDEEYSEKVLNIFNLYIANILYKIVIYEFYDKEMINFLNDTYFFLKPDELNDIEVMSMKILKGEELIIDESGIYCMNRKNNIIEKIVNCIEESKEININGFITFRMKELKEDIEAIIDKVVEKYMVEKEYSEFIKLLKYFVEIQESKIDEINIVIDNQGKYKIKDKDGKEIINEFLIDLSSERVNENNIEDLLISGLITNSPQKINIHGAKNCLNKEVIDTIKNVFTDRVNFCEECKMCKTVKETIQV